MAGRGSAIVGVGCALGLALAPWPGGAASAEPVGLDDAQLDGVVAAGHVPSVSGLDGGYVSRSTQITTQISMPMATAIAICFMCTGDASAVAEANALGTGAADAFAFSSGQADTYAISNAIGPYLMLVPPPAPPPARGSRGAER